MLKTEKIVLRVLKTQKDLQQALQMPVSAEDHLLYAAVRAEDAKALIRHGLPCIFIEKEGAEKVYGADMIVRETDDWDWKNDRQFLSRIWQRHYQLPWTIAETERLLIRESVPEDFRQIYKFYESEIQNPDVKPFPEDNAEAAFLAYIRGQYPLFGYGLWTVVEKKAGCVVGRIGFEMLQEELPEPFELPELSVLIGTEYRGRGYAKEAAKALLSYAADELELPGILYRTSITNRASLALAESLKFISLNRYNLTKTKDESIYMVCLFRS